MNDTPQGDGNMTVHNASCFLFSLIIRMNDTPQGDGNYNLSQVY